MAASWSRAKVSDLYRGNIVHFVQNNVPFYGALKFVESGRFGKVVSVDGLVVELDPDKVVDVFR